MFNVAICDDDKNFIQYVEDIIKELGYAEDVKFFEYLSGEEFLFDIDERGDLDLVVLDIQMGETDGNQVSVELRKRYKSTTLVFCSGYFKPSPENIKVSPFRFLLKEYSRERMVSEFKEIFEYLTNNKDEPSIVCRGERSQVQVYANEIMYIEISKRGTKVHTLNKGGLVEKVYSCKKSLDFLYELFKESNFAYAHNSYIVNLKYVKINQANDKYMELLHNSNHYMRTVYGLLEQDNKDEAINIMDSVLTEYEEGELIEYSTNSILNTILSEYYDKSKTNHIEFNIFVEPGFNIECVESKDLVAMVSNLISNAYEAALKSDEKKIKVQMYMQNDGSFIIIKIENSFSGEIVRQGDRLLTTKKDGNIHGVGIESVEKVAEKYDGWVSTSWGNKSFRTMLVLNNSYVV